MRRIIHAIRADRSAQAVVVNVKIRAKARDGVFKLFGDNRQIRRRDLVSRQPRIHRKHQAQQPIVLARPVEARADVGFLDPT